MTNQIPIPQLEQLITALLRKHSMMVYKDLTAGYTKEDRDTAFNEFTQARKDLSEALIPHY